MYVFFFTFLCHTDGKIGHFCTTLWPQWDPLYIMQRCYFWQFFSYTIGIWEKVHAYFSLLARMCVLCINANCLFQNTVVTNSYVWKYLLLIWWVYKFMTSLNLCCNHSHYFYRCKHGVIKRISLITIHCWCYTKLPRNNKPCCQEIYRQNKHTVRFI